MGADPKYNLGQLGLNLVASPLHLPDGTLLVAQNVEIIRNEGLGGIGSRPGIAALNPDALGAAVVAMFNIPLDTEGFNDEPGVLQALFPFTNGAEEQVWLGTDDATSFVEQASPAQPSNVPQDILGRGAGFATVDGVMYYISGTGSGATIWSWDGIDNEEAIDSFPGDVGYTLFGVFHLLSANGTLYISTLFNGMSDDRIYVYEWDGATLTQVGEPITTSGISMVPVGLAYAFDLLFVGSDDTNGAAEVYRIDPEGGGSWTLDETFAGTLQLHWLQAFDDELYASFAPVTQGGGTNGKVQVRNSGGSWTDSFNGPDDQAEFVGPMVEYLGDLYLAWGNRNTPRQSIYRFDGMSWVEDLNIISEFSLDGTILRRGQPIVVANCLLWSWFDIDVSANADIFKRTAGADWNQAVENELILDGAGGI